MSKNAILSSAIFVALLVVAVVTQRDEVRVGMREMNLSLTGVLPLDAITLSGKHTAALERNGDTWSVKGPLATPNAASPNAASPNAANPNAKTGKDGKAPVANDDSPKKLAKKLAKKPGKIVGPFLADAAAVKRAVDAVGELSVGTFVTSRKEKHADLQVDDATGTKVVLKGAKASIVLVVGRSTEGGGFFVRKDGSDDVFIGKGSLATALKHDLKAWREKKLLPSAKLDTTQAITVRPATGASYSLAGKADVTEPAKTTWAFSTPLPPNFRADAAALARIARSATTLRANDFVDDKTPSEVGIGNNGSIEVVSIEGTKIEVLFGNLDDKKANVFAQVKGAPQVYLVSKYTRDSLLKDALSHRDLSLIVGDAKTVTRVRFQKGDSIVDVTKTEGVWLLASPLELPTGFVFDPASVEPKIAALLRVKGSSYVGPSPFAAPVATDTTVDIFFAGKDAPTKVVLAAVPPDAKPSVKVRAVTSSDQSAYLVAGFHAKRYAAPLDLFKKVDRPPPPPGGGRGGMAGLENLPPEIRKQIEAQMRSGQLGR